MPVTAKHRKVQTNTMKAYQRPQQYIYQLGHVNPGLGLLVSVCILMLPMLGLVDEHAQLATMDHTSIHQCYIHLCHGHMTSHHTSLVLPSLNNVIPAMVLQNTLVRMSVRCPLYTCVHHVSPINLPSDLHGRKVVGMVLVSLLLLSGDIETNPGPVGEFQY